LERFDYQLEPGGDYAFTIRAELWWGARG
jgi:hypothetical protein